MLATARLPGEADRGGKSHPSQPSDRERLLSRCPFTGNLVTGV